MKNARMTRVRLLKMLIIDRKQMKALLLFVSLLASAALVSYGQAVSPNDSGQVTLPKQPVVIVGGNLIDVETGKVRDNVSLLIENEIIKKIGKNLKVPDGATVIDAKGKWLIPGLIDSHIHLFQSGSIY